MRIGFFVSRPFSEAVHGQRVAIQNQEGFK